MIGFLVQQLAALRSCWARRIQEKESWGGEDHPDETRGGGTKMELEFCVRDPDQQELRSESLCRVLTQVGNLEDWGQLRFSWNPSMDEFDCGSQHNFIYQSDVKSWPHSVLAVEKCQGLGL